MKLGKFTKHDSDEFSQLLLAQLKGISHIDLLILKGHILVEYAMNKFIDSFSDHNISIEKTRFTFSQKMEICKILGLFFSDESDNLEKDIKFLNKLRNEIAHNLTYDRQILESLFKNHPDEENVLGRFKQHTKDLKMLRWIILYVCGIILGRLEGKLSKHVRVKKIKLTAAYIGLKQVGLDEITMNNCNIIELKYRLTKLRSTTE